MVENVSLYTSYCCTECNLSAFLLLSLIVIMSNNFNILLTKMPRDLLHIEHLIGLEICAF